MRILLFSPLPPPAGGMALWTKQYLDYIQNKDISVDLINTAVTGKRSSDYTKKSLFEETLRALKMLKSVFICATNKKYDYAHINTSCSKGGIIRDRMVMQILHFFKIRIIVQCHCNIDFALRNKNSYKNFKKMLKLSDKCLVLNKSSENFVKEKFHTDAILVPNFIPKEYQRIINSPKKINDEVKIALFVGHILTTKGCDNIIDAAKRFQDIEFRLVGHISEIYRNIELPENVILTGEKTHEQVNEEYANADIMLFPTYTEGFPLTILEAMAYGLPIITTQVGAIPDILEQRGAIYVPINSTNCLVDAIEQIKDKQRRVDMSYFNKEKVNKYQIDTVLDSLIKDIYYS